MRPKWYVEFLIILAMIVIAIIGVLNIDFTGTPTKIPDTKTEKNGEALPPSSKKERWLQARSLFKSNCASCHNIKFDGVGPPLKDVTARWKAAGSYQGKTGEQWMYIWIHNWHDVVDAKYKYGVDMANSRPAQMNVFVGLTNKDIDDILFYVESPDMGAQQ